MRRWRGGERRGGEGEEEKEDGEQGEREFEGGREGDDMVTVGDGELTTWLASVEVMNNTSMTSNASRV